MTDSNKITVRPAQLISILKSCFRKLMPMFIWGAPGVGKSAIVRQVADFFFGTEDNPGVHFVDVRAMLLDPVDLRGIPKVIDAVTRWFAPCFLPVVGAAAPGGGVFAKRGVVFIDELSQCDPSVQSALLQLVLDRRLGEYVLPDGWVIVAAGNRISDGTFSKKLSKALGSRFVTHVDLDVNMKDWSEWAVGEGNIAHEVLAFLRFRPEFLHQFDPKAEGNSFPCPRTWEFVSQFVGELDADVQLPFLAGSLGHGPAVEFISFLRLYRDLPDIDEVIMNPTGAAVPKEPASQYALCGALARKTTAQSAKAAFTYMDRLPVEMQVVWLRDSLKLSTEVAKTKEFTDWTVKHGDILT